MHGSPTSVPETSLTDRSAPPPRPAAVADQPRDAGSGTPALKEWGAVAHALLAGRQTVLLRKGGIHERRFVVGQDRFLLFPTTAHSHAERVRAEHADLLVPGAADVSDDQVVIRAAVELVAAVTVTEPAGLPDIADLHIWTDASVLADRVAFRPRHPLEALVVRARRLSQPLVVPRLEAYGGCRSWITLPLSWPADARAVLPEERLRADAARVRAAVGGATAGR